MAEKQAPSSAQRRASECLKRYTGYREGGVDKASDEEAEARIRTKKLFRSGLWRYTVHKSIGDIVEANGFDSDYEPTDKKQLCYFRWYSKIVSVMMECGSIDFAQEVLLTLTTQKNKKVDDLTNPWPVLFYEEDAIYILATYNLESFKYLLKHFIISFKKSCLDSVKQQLLELAKKKPSEGLSEQIEEFASREATNIFNQQRKATKGIEKLLATELFDENKITAPLFSIISKEIHPDKMPAASSGPKSWEGHLSKVCSTKLSFILEGEKKMSELEFFDLEMDVGSLKDPKRVTTDYLKMFNDASNPNPSNKTWSKFSEAGHTRRFREDFSENWLKQKLHYVESC